MKPLTEQFIQYIEEQRLFDKNDRLLLAVSGGVDSVVLCELCHRCGYNFTIAHCNFRLRGAESARDEQFVRSCAEKYKAEVLVKQFDTAIFADANKLSVQVAARQLRYDWFNEILRTHPSSLAYLLTAHHANDNVETVMMNFFKGTGIAGLRGIMPKQGQLVRPLLFAFKEELQQFATENGLKYVEDSSNASSKYTRNYFRNELIPSLEKVYPQVEGNIHHNIQRFREIEELYQQAIVAHKKKLLEYKGNEVHIPILKLQQHKPLETIVYEITRAYGFTAHQTGEIIQLIHSGAGKYIQSATHRIINNRKWLIISPLETTEADYIIIEADQSKINFGGGMLELKQMAASDIKINPDAALAYIDARYLSFPLILRKWKLGDYFYPLGMHKKKKVNRFLIDQKASLTEKENTWVLESDKKIVWIIGRRMDDRFKVIPSTQNIWVLRYSQQ